MSTAKTIICFFFEHNLPKPNLEISDAFLISLEVSFLHGLSLLFLSLEAFYQRVSGSDF